MNYCHVAGVLGAHSTWGNCNCYGDKIGSCKVLRGSQGLVRGSYTAPGTDLFRAIENWAFACFSYIYIPWGENNAAFWVVGREVCAL